MESTKPWVEFCNSANMQKSIRSNGGSLSSRVKTHACYKHSDEISDQGSVIEYTIYGIWALSGILQKSGFHEADLRIGRRGA